MPKKNDLRESETKVALSLFSGARGLDVGVLQAGFDVLACIEIDPHCCATLVSNCVS